MTKDHPSEKKDVQATREARLAAQLRENLKRRKAQARARNDAGRTGKTPDDGGTETGQA